VVECFLAKEDVAGSTPVSRSKYVLPAVHFSCNSPGQKMAHPGRGTQVVRERSAKPLCVGSIPTRASKFFNNLATSQKDLVAKMVINWANSLTTSLLYLHRIDRKFSRDHIPQLTADHVCCVVRPFIENVSVVPHHDVRARMTKPLLHDFGVHSIPDHLG
jgi:hypothetical protein